ncbi:MAG: glycine zipper 2TM domain-containing protein [Rhodanobacter sp.]
MNKVMINALSIGIAAALAVGISGCNRNADAGTSDGGAMSSATADAGVKYAKVISVEPVRKAADTSRQVCQDEVVNHTAPPKDEHRLVGTAIGAVAGGLLGNQVGGGKGKTLATVAGAVGGGYAGNRIEASRQHGQVTSNVERRCHTVKGTGESKIVGYDVGYVYNGVTRSVRMDHDPGDRVQVQEGVTAVSDAR